MKITIEGGQEEITALIQSLVASEVVVSENAGIKLSPAVLPTDSGATPEEETSA